MKSTLLRTCLATVLVLSVTLAAGDAAARTKSPNKALARKHYKAGKKAYADGEFKKAAKEFSAGYLHDSKPAFLINIAQSYRKADDPEQAAHYYREYLRADPDSSLAPQVRGLITEIEDEIKKREEAAKPPPPPPDAVTTTPPPPPPSRPTPFYQKWWFWTAVGAVVVTSVSVGIYAGTKEPDYVKEGGLGSVAW